MSTSFQTVSELVGQIKNSLESDYGQVKVEGEVSNLSSSGAGHFYFTLKDHDSAVSCVLFRGDAMRNPIINKLKDGDKIQTMGGISVYQKRGTFQVIAKWLKPAGKGDLKEKFELLKKKLSLEGLFDLEKKNPIPPMALRIGVITAEGAAALQDFLKVFQRRSIWMDIVVFPSLVQGDAAPAQLLNAIDKAEAYSKKFPLDILVLTRGGGSLEDLWAFNDEKLARRVFSCSIPTISAIGHEVDYALTDFVADYRAETPTAAAEYITREQVKLREKMLSIRQRLLGQAKMLSAETKLKLRNFHPSRLVGLILDKITKQKNKLRELNVWDRKDRLLPLNEHKMKLDDYSNRMLVSIGHLLSAEKKKVGHLYSMLNSLGPHSVLKRGFSYVEDESGQVRSSKASFKKTDDKTPLSIHFHDGSIEVEYKKK
jgi:exodeoxyribonuclease VII large subunit